MTQKEVKNFYGVLILKRNQDHILVLETENFEEGLEVYKDLKTKWKESLDTQSPFELTKPVITAFDPGLIYEITFKPIGRDLRVNNNNPYQQQMEKEGLSNVLNRYGIYDQGYKA